MDNLLSAWQEFIRDKRNKPDVQLFQLNLMDNLIQLHEDLRNLTYKHGEYKSFRINDPKPRHIHKATVRDRIVHRAIYRILYPFFQKTFIADSFSCQINKGTHKALNRFRAFGYKASHNNTKTCWILKCDIRKFFDNIDHQILKNILNLYISDEKIRWLLNCVIGSFRKEERIEIGLPLGNLTSQLFVNIYMNEFDQFVKHRLKLKHYIRYADDFVVFSENRDWLGSLIPIIREFLENKLKLQLHPKKVSIETLAFGVDFLGWVHFTDHRVLRAATRRRMMARIAEDPRPEVIQSYLGLISHGEGYKLGGFIYRILRQKASE